MGTGGQGKFYFMGGVFFFFLKSASRPPLMINSGIALNSVLHLPLKGQEKSPESATVTNRSPTNYN